MIMPAINLLEKLVQWDKWLFVKINSQWTNSMFDQLFPLWRTAEFWAPLYLFLLLFTVTNFKTRGAWWALLFLCTFAACDITGTLAFKKVVERVRPCNDAVFSTQVRLLLDHCGSGFSFISNHAANHFGMGVFSFITFRQVIGKWAWLGPAWAFSVAYAQVYVGVHYPLDVMAGAVLGTIFGMGIGTLFNKRYGFVIFAH